MKPNIPGREAMPGTAMPTVLHYTGYTWEGGGVDAVARSLSIAGPSRALLGVSVGAPPARPGGPHLWRGPAVEGEEINLRNLARTWRVARRVARWLARDPQRVFHGHSRAGLLVALWLDFLGARRVVVSVHCHARRRWFYRWAARRLHGRLWWLTPAMRRHYGLSDAGWGGCMPNGLGGDPQPLRRWPGGRALRVGGAGLLVPVKRWETVVRALAQLRLEEAVHFTHVGREFDTEAARAYARELRASAVQAGLGARLTWSDWQPGLADFFAQIDVLVVPSELESFSLVALEALWAGVPVITARGGGTEHLIEEGVSGWSFAAGDPAALAAAWRHCLAPGAWARVAGVAPGLDRFRLDRLAQEWAKIYRGL